MMASDPWDMPAAPPLPRREPSVTALDLAGQLLLEDPAARVKLLAAGRETWAKGIIKIDPDGNVVIC